MPGFQKLAKPLYRKLSKQEEFVWKEEDEEQRIKLIRAIDEGIKLETKRLGEGLKGSINLIEVDNLY